MWALTLRNVIDFWLLVYGVRYRSKFILLHVESQLWQQHLLTRLMFHPLNCLDTFDKKQSTIKLRIYFCTLDNYDYCSFLISFKIKECQSSKIVLLFQDCFGYSGSVAIPQFYMSFRISFSSSKNKKQTNKKPTSDSQRNCIDYVDHLQHY